MGNTLLQLVRSPVGEYKGNRRACGNVEIAPAISKDGGKSGNPGFGFPGFPRSGISTSVFSLRSYPAAGAARDVAHGGRRDRRCPDSLAAPVRTALGNSAHPKLA